jgi:glutamate synthase (NADPH/NADH) small chain
MEKRHLRRRIEQMEAEGVTFKPSTNIGVDIKADELKGQFDAVVLCGGATAPRDLPIPGRQLKGIVFAMDFLPLQNKLVAGDKIPAEQFISAEGKHVIIIGGGDTGADCLGTSHRQKCASIHQFEIVPKPPEARADWNPWPQWPNIYRTSGAHKEGGQREFSINTKEFIDDGKGNVKALRTCQVEMKMENGRPNFVDVPGTEKIYDADLVLLAMGFVGPEKKGMLEQFGVELDRMGNVKADDHKMTSVPGVFTAGDMTRGQSLIVWAIAEGRHAAYGVDQYLMGETDLPKPLEFGNSMRPFA